MRPTNEEITRKHVDPPGADPFVPGREPKPYLIRVEEYDDGWPADFERVAATIRGAIGERALEIHHVGSTSVPGLPAKPIIDVDLVVADPAEEMAYVADLEKGGLPVIREPWWHEHRLLRGTDPATNLHVFGPDCPEVIRNLMFREWLLDNPDELTTYVAAKRAATEAMNAGGGATMMDYNRHKEPVVLAILDRMFRAHGMLP